MKNVNAISQSGPATRANGHRVSVNRKTETAVSVSFEAMCEVIFSVKSLHLGLKLTVTRLFWKNTPQFWLRKPRQQISS